LRALTIKGKGLLTRIDEQKAQTKHEKRRKNLLSRSVGNGKERKRKLMAGEAENLKE